MTVHHGKNGQVKVGANAVVGVTKFTVKESVPTADTTAMADTAETHIVGVPSWTATITVNYDPADTTGQVALAIGASVTVGLYSDGSASGKKYLSGTASVVNCGPEADKGGIVTQTIELKGNGALSHAAAP